jgi:hypothetical protein
MDTEVSILSLLSKLIEDEKQVQVLQLLQKNLYGEELLESLIEIMED